LATHAALITLQHLEGRRCSPPPEPWCPLWCPNHDHSRWLNVTYQATILLRYVLLGYLGSRCIVKSVHWKSACRQFDWFAPSALTLRADSLRSSVLICFANRSAPGHHLKTAS